MAPEWRLAPYGGKYFNSLQRGPDCQWGEHGLAGEDPASWISKAKEIRLEPSDRFGEIPGGRDIYPEYNHPMAHDGAPVWEVEDEDDVKVYAAPMSHGIPCLGYVVKEQSRPGRLRSEYVEPIVRRNIQALKDAGFKIPMKALAVIKNLPEGSAFTFPDGTVVTQQDAVEPPRNGRKVVICGDTSDARAITKLAMDADVVVHEATNAFLDFLDKDSDNLHSITKDSMTHGHSTPQMAAIFAKNINAKRLLLNHFSPRYKGDQDIDSVSIMTRIEHQAMNTGDFDASQVAATWDFMLLPIPPN
jgi:ribonuclease Z